ncbi:MAG TPA: hypothetical protein VMQ83_08570 [Gammaproteobacteria bacterium]|nr:hypothetical protein [Gammaproteobacteria bacterium]
MALFSMLRRARAQDSPAVGPERAAHARRHTAVEIVPHEDACCEAARSLAGTRFLSREVPLFPLPGCDRPQCDCTYRHHPDRRMDIRRAADLGFTVLSKMLFRNANRRNAKTPGRRATDGAPEGRQPPTRPDTD